MTATAPSARPALAHARRRGTRRIATQAIARRQALAAREHGTPARVPARVPAAIARRDHATRHLRRTFGITQADYDAMLARRAAGARSAGEPAGKVALHVDHDHETGAVRGLLCVACNDALGQFDDVAELLARAADYVGRGVRTSASRRAGDSRVSGRGSCVRSARIGSPPMIESPLPSFGPGLDPGSSFVDLLRQVAPDEPPGCRARRAGRRRRSRSPTAPPWSRSATPAAW